MICVEIDKVENFICECFSLLNGIVNPDHLVHGVIFYEKIDEYLGYLDELSDGNTYIIVGKENLRRVLGHNVDYYYYTLLVDFVLHELFHSIQNIDMNRYQNDEYYRDLVEEEAQFNAARFLNNYYEWLSCKLNKPIYPTANDLYKQRLIDTKNKEREHMLEHPYIFDLKK